MIDVKKLSYDLLETAKSLLVQEGHLTPVAFIVTPGKIITAPLDLRSQITKMLSIELVSEFAKKMDASAVILIVDAYTKQVATKEEVLKYVPGSLASDKQAIDTISLLVSSGDGNGWGILNNYHKEGDTYYFDKPNEEGEIDAENSAMLPIWKMKSAAQ